MKLAIKDRFNNMLSTNTALNTASDLNEKTKQLQKGNNLRLLRNLLIGSYATMLLSFMASVFGYGSSSGYLLMTLATNFIGVLISNIIFVSFLKCTDHQKLTGEDVTLLLKKFLLQAVCALLITLLQSFTNIILLQATIYIPTLNVLASILTSLIFTMINALIAFQIYDGTAKVKTLLSNAFSVFTKNWRSLLFMSMLFMAWSYVFSIAFTLLLYGHLQQQQGINNIFHSLLQQHDYANFGKVNLFYLINYLVAGYLEIKILLALAISYKSAFHSKKHKKQKKTMRS